MKTQSTARVRPERARPRDRYAHLWRGAPGAPAPAETYWASTRRPIASLAFVLPLIVAYEAGVWAIGGASADTLRTGADAWVRGAMGSIGLRDRLLPPLALVASLVAWQAFRPGSWRFRPRVLFGMAAESVALAVALVGLSRLVELGFDRMEFSTTLQVARASAVVGYIGAGVYEEALFRLALIPLFYQGARVIHAPATLAGTLAVTGSSLLFSLAHHAGSPGEAFTLYAFIFRWLAGIFFAWVFLARGFGVAVGAHAAYDVLVGWVGLHF